MPEVIQLDGSPSELLAAADVGDNGDDTEVSTPQQQDAGDEDEGGGEAGCEGVRGCVGG